MIAACARRNEIHESSLDVDLVVVVIAITPCALKCSGETATSGPVDRFFDMSANANGIVVEGLVRQFKDVRAVDGIDLLIEPGEIYGFLGPNGAGKSTTVHMLTTLLPPTAGRATVAGSTSSTTARRCAPRSAPHSRRRRSIRS